MSKNSHSIFNIVILSALLLTACIETPDEIISPEWDIQLSIPVTLREYSLEDAVIEEENLVASTDPASLGIIYYTQVEELESIYFKDELKVDDFSVLSSQSVGSIKLNDLNPVSAEIPVQQWTSQIIPGQSQIFPPQQGNFTEAFNEIDDFEEVTFEEGFIDLTIVNDLPVDIILEGLILRNVFDNTIIAEIPNTPSSNWIDIPEQDSVMVALDITDKTIMNQVEVTSVLSTPGSDGEVVNIGQDAGTRFTAMIRNGSKVRSAFAPLPPQDPFAKDSSLLIDDSVQPTQLENAEFRTGYFDIILNNNLDLEISVNIKIHNLFRTDNSPYDVTIDMNRKERDKTVREPEIRNWKVRNPRGPSEFLESTITVYTESSSEPRLINKTDNILVEMKFHEIKFISVEGRISPTEISFDNSQLTLDIGELEDKFSFSEIRFENPALYIQLNSTADIETELDAVVNGSNGNQQNSMNITDLLIPSLANTQKDLTEYGFKEFLNSFQNKLPSEFLVSGSATGNPNYLLGEVHQNDSIASSLLLELPLDIGISGGAFVDTFDIDLGSIDESELKRVNYGTITIEFENEVPVELAFTARSLDSLNNEKLSIPPRPIQPQNLDYILVNAPAVNSQGNVTSPGTTTTEIEIFNDEIRKFLSNRKLAVRFDFLTPPEGRLDPVKFRISDLLKLKAYATLNYRADID